MSGFVEPPDCVETQMGEVVAQILQILFREYLGLRGMETRAMPEGILQRSPFVRYDAG
jgi:hypothetical protein